MRWRGNTASRRAPHQPRQHFRGDARGSASPGTAGRDPVDPLPAVARPLPVFESGPIPAFAAAVTLCGLQAKLVDERADERGLRAVGSRLLAALSRPRFDRAQAILVASGFPVNDARHQLDLQVSIRRALRAGSLRPRRRKPPAGPSARSWPTQHGWPVKMTTPHPCTESDTASAHSCTPWMPTRTSTKMADEDVSTTWPP